MRKLTVKVIIVFVLLVLPLNALAVFQADSMIASTLDQIRMTEQNIGPWARPLRLQATIMTA